MTPVRSLMWHVISRFRNMSRALADGAAWSLALVCGTLARYDFDVHHVWSRGLLVAVLLAIVLQWFAGRLLGIYTGRSRLGSFDEIRPLALTATLVTAALVTVDIAVSPRMIPLGVCLAGGLAGLVLMGASRAVWRLAVERVHRFTGTPILVFGAGEAGAQIVHAMLRDRTSGYRPVGLLDDDRAKRRLRIAGVPVLGAREELREAAVRTGADILLIAIPSADATLIRSLTALAEEADLGVRILPSLVEMIDAPPLAASHIRDVTAADLLGRHPVETDLSAISESLTGRRVMVTGAGGSIGSELCRQISGFAPMALIMVDRDESALHAVQLSIEGRALLDSPDLVLVDIRDPEAVQKVFEQHRPDVVFHAAALKHLTLLERHPAEAVKTNVHGTLNVLEAARSVGTQQFVNVSTDKAADPECVLGYTKRIAERLTSHYAQSGVGTYISVRFGNVLGSRGSVLSIFQAQLDQGEPLTVTHPEVERYFMTVQEAVQLVLQAGTLGAPGEVLVLDMGQPVRIADVAQMLIDRAGVDLAIEFTGLRPGEKLTERRLGAGERDRRPEHELISHVLVPPLGPALLDELATTQCDDELRRSMRALAQGGEHLVIDLAAEEGGHIRRSRASSTGAHYVVTGCAGFIGSHLTEALLAMGHRVTGIDALTPYYSPELKRDHLATALENPAFTFVEADLSEYGGLTDLAAESDGIFHLAAQAGVRASWGRGFDGYVRDNLLATQAVLEAAAGLTRVVFASSSSVYGDASAYPTPETARLAPLSPYGVTKLGCEALVSAYGASRGLDAVGLRYFTVYGPRQRPDMAFTRVAQALLSDTSFTLNGDGQQRRDLTYVADAVAATVLAMTCGVRGRVYNVGGGHEVSLREVIDEFQRCADRQLRIEAAPAATGDARRTGADTATLRADCGWVPATSVEAGVAAHWAWAERSVLARR